MLWDARFNQLCSSLKIPKSDLERKAKVNDKSSPERPRRRRNSSRTKSCSEKSGSESDAELSKESRRRKSLLNGQTDANVGGTVENTTRDKHTEELDNYLKEIVSEKLRMRFVVSSIDMQSLVSIQTAELAQGHVLAAGATDQQILKAVKACGFVVHPIKTAESTSYIFAKVDYDDGLDDIRMFIFNLLKEGKGILNRNLKKQIYEQLHIKPSDADVKKILHEFCFTRGNQYHLKGTDLLL